MSIIDTLITNRTQADVDALLALYAKPKAMWTTDEWNEFLLGNHRGAYNATDMNRVLDALDYLAERVTEFGYRKPEIKRPSITEVIPGTSKLPEGYTELEYIQSTGTEYVDTGLKPNQDSRAVADVQFMSFPSGHSAIFGSYDSVNQWWAYYRYDQSQYRAVNGGTTQKSVAYADPTLRATLDLQNGLYRVNDTEVTWSQDEFSIDSSVYLFALNRQGGSMQYPASCRMYSCKIYDNGTLIRNYVPCLTPSNEVGLYDIVNGVFYGNAGTGDFIAGPENDNIPSQTIERDYYAIGDRPPESELRNYLDNVATIRSVLELPARTPEVPEDISKRILIEEANNIEIILTAVELLLDRIARALVYSGEFTAGEV